MSAGFLNREMLQPMFITTVNQGTGYIGLTLVFPENEERHEKSDGFWKGSHARGPTL